MDIAETEIDNIIESSIKNIITQYDITNDTQCNITNANNSSNNTNANNSSNNTNGNNIDNIDNTIQAESIPQNRTINTAEVEVFNIALHQYLKVNEEIKLLTDALKLRNKTKIQLAETLSVYLQSNQIKNVNLEGSYKGKKLETKQIYSSKGFSKEKVTSILCEELKQETVIFEKIMQSIGKTNSITEKIQLRIVVDKPPSTKKIKDNSNSS